MRKKELDGKSEKRKEKINIGIEYNALLKKKNLIILRALFDKLLYFFLKLYMEFNITLAT